MPVEDVAQAVREMRAIREAEHYRLTRIATYLRDPNYGGDGSRPQMLVNGEIVGPNAWLPRNVPSDVRNLADISRVNMLRFVVNAVVQVMYVDGYRAPKESDEAQPWEAWQLNRMDSRQTGVHRGALSYGASYVSVLPGDNGPVLRGHSPLKMTVAYTSTDDDWPVMALERRRGADKTRRLYRLFDDENVYWVTVNDQGEVEVDAAPTERHGMGVCPIVRFRPTIDDDTNGPSEGEVEPLIPLQDQINITTFGLLVAQHYGAHRQRYILGWLAENEQQALTASAKKLWTFEDPETKVGEFSQTDLSGYIASREATLRHLATVSQTPAHELLGQIANLSAEALAAAEANHRRKVQERQVVMGEAWEQVLELAGTQMPGVTIDPMAQVRWRDTEARSLSAAVDALGKMATLLGIPPSELWERIPGVTQADVERWKATAESGDAIAQLTAVLTKQAVPGETAPAAPTNTPPITGV